MEEENIISTISYKQNGEEHTIECKGKGCYEKCCIGGCRYKLEISISGCDSKNKHKTLACIMMNPSTTFPNEEWENLNWENKLGFEECGKTPRRTKGFDPTVTNVLKMAASKDYTKVCIFNLFPYIHPTGKIAIEHYKKNQEQNKEAIMNWKDDNCKKVLIAWGHTSPKESDEYESIKKECIKIFRGKKIKPVFYAWNNKADCPYHPSPQVNSCWTEKNGKIVKRKKNDNTLGIVQQFIDKKDDFQYIKDGFFQ